MESPSCLEWFATTSQTERVTISPGVRSKFSVELKQRWHAVLSLQPNSLCSLLPEALQKLPDDQSLLATLLLYSAATHYQPNAGEIVACLKSLGAVADGKDGTCFFLWQLCCASPDVPWCPQRTTPAQLASLVDNQIVLSMLEAAPALGSSQKCSGGDGGRCRCCHDYRTARELLSKGWQIEKNFELLCKAATDGDVGVVRLLYHYGAVEDKNNGCIGVTPLCCALHAHRFSIAEIILGYMPSLKGSDRKPLELVMSTCFNEVDIVFHCYQELQSLAKIFETLQRYMYRKHFQQLLHRVEHCLQREYTRDRAFEGCKVGLWQLLVSARQQAGAHLLYTTLDSRNEEPTPSSQFFNLAIKLRCSDAVRLFLASHKSAKTAQTSVHGATSSGGPTTLVEQAAYELGQECRKLVQAPSNAACIELLRIIRSFCDAGLAAGAPHHWLSEGLRSRCNVRPSGYRGGGAPAAHIERYHLYMDVMLRVRHWSPTNHVLFPHSFKVMAATLLMTHNACVRAAAREHNSEAACHKLALLPEDVVHKVMMLAADDIAEWM